MFKGQWYTLILVKVKNLEKGAAFNNKQHDMLKA